MRQCPPPDIAAMNPLERILAKMECDSVNSYDDLVGAMLNKKRGEFLQRSAAMTRTAFRLIALKNAKGGFIFLNFSK